MKKFVLATIGSTAFSAEAQQGRIDLYAQVDGPLSPGQMRQIGISLAFDDIDAFERAVIAALKVAREKPKRK